MVSASTTTVLFSTMISLSAIHYSVAMWFFLRWRNVWPISGRSTPVIAVAATSIAAWSLFDKSTGLVERHPCWLEMAIVVTSLVLIINSYVVRTFCVWFHYFTAVEQLRVLRPDRKNPGKRRSFSLDDSWFRDRKHWAATPNLLKMMLALSAVMVLGPVIAFFLQEDSMKGTLVAADCFPVLRIPFYVYAGVTFGLGIFAGASANKIKEVDDGFGIIFEMMVGSVLGTFCMFIVVVLPTFVSEPLITKGLLWIGSHLVTFILISRPAYLAFLTLRRNSKAKRRRMQNSSQRSAAQYSTTDIPLAEVLENSELREAFVEHLKLEFSVEHIIFLEQVEEFVALCEAGELNDIIERNTRAAEIYANFVWEEALQQVNISFKRRALVSDELSTCISNFNPREHASNADQAPPDDAASIFGASLAAPRELTGSITFSGDALLPPHIALSNQTQSVSAAVDVRREQTLTFQGDTPLPPHIELAQSQTQPSSLNTDTCAVPEEAARLEQTPTLTFQGDTPLPPHIELAHPQPPNGKPKGVELKRQSVDMTKPVEDVSSSKKLTEDVASSKVEDVDSSKVEDVVSSKVPMGDVASPKDVAGPRKLIGDIALSSDSTFASSRGRFTSRSTQRTPAWAPRALQCIRLCPVTVFDVARREVFALLENDSYQRFKSKKRQELRENLKGDV